MEVDAEKIIALAESAERRAKELHRKYVDAGTTRLNAAQRHANLLATKSAMEESGYLNDFFYWSGKATSYRGIIAMAELQTVVDDELDAEPTCP